MRSYMTIWNPVIGYDSIFCQIVKEPPFDESAVAVIHNNLHHNRVVGHIPANIFSLFKRFLGLPTSSIAATVTGKRVNRGAGDGLEIPVTYSFVSDERAIIGWIKSRLEKKMLYWRKVKKMF